MRPPALVDVANRPPGPGEGMAILSLMSHGSSVLGPKDLGGPAAEVFRTISIAERNSLWARAERSGLTFRYFLNEHEPRSPSGSAQEVLSAKLQRSCSTLFRKLPASPSRRMITPTDESPT